MRHLALPCSLLIATACWAQQPQAAAPAASAASAPADSIGYASVSAALAELQARDGNGTVVTHSDGWTVINEPLAAAQWSFVPADHPAHPAVVRRIVRRGPAGAVSVETSSLCEAAAAPCAQLLEEFAAMNDRIVQAVKGRLRQGSSGAQQQMLRPQ